LALNGGQNNNSVGSGGCCDSTQAGQAVCWDATLPLSTILGGSPITFSASITDGSEGTLHVQATGYDNSAGSQLNGGKVLAVSNDLTAVPEPSSPMLLSVGLLGALAIARSKLVKA